MNQDPKERWMSHTYSLLKWKFTMFYQENMTADWDFLSNIIVQILYEHNK